MKKKHCGNNLRVLRDIFNYTQEYVASALKISVRQYRKFEHIEKMPSEYYLYKLEKLYKIAIRNFLQMTEEEIVEKVFK